LVHDGNDPTTTLYSGLVQTMECSSNRTIENIVRSLKARGGQRQSIMFLTGPAGCGKRTAVTVAQKFCHEFCVAVGVMWSDTTFLFTAYTEAAASLFGGVSISKATFLNKQKPLSLEDINIWQENQIFFVDEVSFMHDSILKTLDTKLKVIKDGNKSFGGFSIIFSRDLRQLPPVGSTEFKLIYSSLSSKHWENCINVIIILDNAHRFKDNPWYGQMLKRMWDGELNEENREIDAWCCNSKDTTGAMGTCVCRGIVKLQFRHNAKNCTSTIWRQANRHTKPSSLFILCQLAPPATSQLK